MRTCMIHACDIFGHIPNKTIRPINFSKNFVTLKILEFRNPYFLKPAVGPLSLIDWAHIVTIGTGFSYCTKYQLLRVGLAGQGSSYAIL